MALHKVFNPSKNNLRIKIIVKRTEDILVETHTEKSLKKLKDSAAIKKKFNEQKMTSTELRIAVYDILSKVLVENEITELIFEQNDIDMK